MLQKRFIKFLHGILISPNKSLAFIGRMSLTNPCSSIGKNYRHIMSVYRIAPNDWSGESPHCMVKILYDYYSKSLNDDMMCTLEILRCLLHMRDFPSDNDIFSQNECTSFIESICTM